MIEVYKTKNGDSPRKVYSPSNDISDVLLANEILLRGTDKDARDAVKKLGKRATYRPVFWRRNPETQKGIYTDYIVTIPRKKEWFWQ